MKTEEDIKQRMRFIIIELNNMPNKQTWKRRMLCREYKILNEVLFA